MSKKEMTNEEKRLQKKLIPLNIIICIISLAAALSLFFAPLFQLDLGKVIQSESMSAVIEKTVDDAMSGASGGSGSDEVDFTPVISVVVKEVLAKAEGNLSVTAMSSLNVFLSDGEDKSQAVFEELLFAENGLVSELIDSLIDGISHLFENRDFTAVLEKAVVSTLTTQLLKNLPEGVEISESDLTALTETFLTLGGKDREQAQVAADQFADQLERILGDEYDLSEDKQVVSGFIMDLYDDTASAVEGGVSIESMVCVAVSQNVDLSEFDFGEIIKGMSDEQENGGNENSSSTMSHKVVVEGEEEGGGQSTGSSTDGDGNLICTSYSQLMGAMGLGAENTEELRSQVEPAVRSALTDATQEYSEYFGYYGYLFFAVLAFALPWIVLFLFSFIRIFTKNKRFMMWYVKLLGFLPCLLFFILPLVAPSVLPALLPELAMSEEWPMMLAIFGGMKSLTIISGACYVLMWLLSICWAFPVKHKIRKIRKQVKKGTYSEPAASAKSNATQTSSSDGYDSYGSGYSPYDDDDDGFDDDYTSSYGGSIYDDDDDDYYGSSYGSSYGGSIFDDDDDDY